jgi:filamentous hemagglutinin family protein
MATKTVKAARLGLASTALSGTLMALLGAGAAHALDEGALPQGGTVVGGAATIAQSGRTLTVNQSSDRTVIDWRSFDIGSGAQANFNQPGSGSIAVNRVNASANPTEIQGGLHANGQVWILNPNGVMFGKTARVDVAGIVASTANLDAARFMAGDNRLAFTGSGRGAVVNEGSISVAANGLAAFVAPSVRNSGSITAKVGRVALAGGDTFTLDLAGDRLVELGLGSGAAVVDQSGRIVDEGGTVTLTAAAAGQVVDSVINMAGVTSTASARQVGGLIVLEGGAVTVAGTLDASGASGGQITASGKTIAVAAGATLKADAGAAGDGGAITLVALNSGDYAGAYSARGGSVSGAGGKIETSGLSVAVDDAIKVDASAAHGTAGQWLIDPLDVTIASGSGGGLSGSTVTAGAIQTALAGGTGVHITTDQTGAGNGDLTLASSINAASTGNAGLTLDGRHLSATGGSVINIAGGALTLNVNTVNTLADVSAQPTNWIQDANNMVGTVSGGTRINLGAATYANSATIDRSNVFLDGSAGALINVNPGNAQVFGLAIQAGTSGITINGFKLAGEITGSYVDYAFGSGSSRGIVVANTANGFHITNNDIRNVRTGLLVDGRGVSGTSITGNLIDNTKTALFLQYTAGEGIDISGNRQGQYGNEWGGNFHVNGDYDGTNLISRPGGGASTGVQTALLASKTANNGWSVQDQAFDTSNRTDVSVATTGSDANQGSLKAKLATIQSGIAAVVSGGTVNVADGTYVISNSVPYLGIIKSLSLVGQSEAATIIDAHGASQYGLRVTADNVSLRNFTLLGVSGAGNSYGIKVENNIDPSPSARINNFSISNVTSHGARKAQLDMNGVVHATIDHFTADGTSNGFGSGSQAGAGIALTDSADVTITNSTTKNNAYGGLALYQTNTARDQQVTGITVAASNSFNEAVPVYAEDSSASKNFGALSIGGLAYVVHSPSDPADVYTFFEKTEQAAIDLAVLKGPTTATVEGYAGSGLAGNNLFSVGFSSVAPTQFMSIKAALDAALTGATVNVKDGTYVIPGGGTSYLSIDKSLTLRGQSQAGTIIDARGATAYGLRVQGDNVALSNFTLLGSKVVGGYGIKVEPLNLASPDSRLNGFAIDHVTIDGATKNALDLNGAHVATIDHVTAKNAVGGNGVALIDSSDVAITNSTTANNAWGGLRIEQKNVSFNQQTNAITVAANNSFNEASPVYLEDESATKDFGTLTIAGFDYVVKSPGNPADIYTWFQKTQQGAIDLAAAQSLSGATVQSYSGAGSTGDNIYTVGVSTGGQALSIQSAQNAASAGAIVNVASGTYAQDVIVSTATNFNFGAVNLASFTLQGAAAGSGLSGSLGAGSIALGGAVNLTGNLSLSTRGSNGAITTAAIDAATPGGATLSVDAGTGTVTLGSLGSTSRLGAVDVAGDATLTGGTYNADSLAFGGNLTLTAASTTLNTTRTGGAGNITVAGSVLGTAGDSQSLTLTAGPGSGGAGSNGDISLQNVGAKALRLNNLTVSGRNFGAQTVDLAGDFGATLVGNQVFSSHTLNARSVSSIVGGNASGPINATSAIQLAVAGALGGAITGTDVSLSANTLSGAQVTASQNAAVTANSVTSSTMNAAQNVTINAGSVTSSTVVAAQTANVVADSVSGSAFNASQGVNLAANTVSLSQFISDETVNLSATNVSGSSLTAPTVTARADTFDGAVVASKTATISGGTISGDFSGGSFDITGADSVNAKVNATKVSVTAPQGSVTGVWQTITGGGGVTANNAVVAPPVTPTPPAPPATPVTPVTPTTPAAPAAPKPGRGPSPNQIVVQNFPLPAGAAVTPTGQIVLPQALVIGLISPGGASGAPKLVQVQSVQELGSLLGEGYTAIVIDLSGRKKDKKPEIRVSAR